MTTAERLESAARSPQAVQSLRSLVGELGREQHTREQIYEQLEQLLLRLRASGREAEEEAVLEIMDALTGWCHPDARLLPED